MTALIHHLASLPAAWQWLIVITTYWVIGTALVKLPDILLRFIERRLS